MKNNWSEVEGNGWARWGTNISGIPNIDPDWVYKTLGGGFNFGSFVISNNIIYIVDGSHVVQSVDVNTGGLLWVGPKADHYLVALSVSENFLLASLCILNPITGDILTDFSKNSGYEFNNSIIPSRFKNYTIQKGNGSDYVVYDFIEKKYSVIKSSLKYENIIWLGDFGGLGFNDKSVAYLDIFNESVNWEIGIQDLSNFSICYTEPYLYLTAALTVYKINAQNGQIIWASHLPDLTDVFKKSYLIQLGVCEDTFHIMTGKKLFGFSTKNGSLLWEAGTKMGLRFCIAGDLIFGIDFRRFVAWDRYSGKEVWEAKEKIYSAYTAKSVDGKVFVNTTDGELYCFSWDENNPYHSPEKPKVTIEA